MTPAAPNTYVVTKDASASEGFTKMPVIGYCYEHGKEKPPVVVTLNGERRILGDDAILFPCGLVVVMIPSVTFESTEAWLEANLEGMTTRGKHTDKTTATKPATTDSVEADGYDIEWTNKSFKNNSFWHYDDGEFEFCFILPGEEDAPKQTEKVKKIKRTEMDALKKNIDVLDLEDVKNPNVLPDADPDEDDDEDEDDGEDDGLI